MVDLTQLDGFDWDEGNRNKNRLKHNVEASECETVFYNQPLLLNEDKAHSQIEQRFQALGMTSEGRKLFIIFTIRGTKIRVISARDQNQIERSVYEQAAKTTSIV